MLALLDWFDPLFKKEVSKPPKLKSSYLGYNTHRQLLS